MTPKNSALFSAHGKTEARRYKTWPDVVSGYPQIEEGCALGTARAKEKISDEEEHWLDNDANDVDECALIQELETASDF
jgi:hypothetical protein